MALSAGRRHAFDALASELQVEGERGELVVVGGVALVLLFGARETMKDVERIFSDATGAAMRTAVARVARQFDVPEDWLNDGAKELLMRLTTAPSELDSDGPTWLAYPGLPSAKWLWLQELPKC